MKLTLRDAFWFVLVAAVGLAWWVDHRQQSKQITRYEYLATSEHAGFVAAELEDFFTEEGYDFEWDSYGGLHISSPRTSRAIGISGPGQPSP